MVRETPPDFPYTERHLKCVWYDPRLRPELRSARREPCHRRESGQWNLEAGPDFLDAVLLVGPEKRRVTGDVEIHIRPADWRRHGHAANPAYRLAAHVTYFPGVSACWRTSAGRGANRAATAVGQGCGFAFEQLDVMAYPRAATWRRLADAGWKPGMPAIRCCWMPPAPEQLRRKSARMASAVAARGAEQVVLRVLCALGYKHNRQPFRELAARVPLAALRGKAPSAMSPPRCPAGRHRRTLAGVRRAAIRRRNNT